MKTDAQKVMLSVQKLVGDINEPDLKNVDYFVSKNFGIFIPSVGYCQYAIRPQHTHPAYSFFLFFSKEQNIIPVNINILPGHYLAAAMAPDVPHEEKETDTFTRYVAIFIAKNFYETIYALYSKELPKPYSWEQFLVEHEIMIYIKKFISETENALPGRQDVMNALATVLTHQLIRGLLSINKSVDFLTEKFEIEKAIAFMHQHFGKKLTIAELARIANMSESHFMRIFKKETGLTPMEFLIRTRLEKAKKLLRMGGKKVTETALECGFNSTSHFSSCFTKYLGMTPSEYKKSYLEK